MLLRAHKRELKNNVKVLEENSSKVTSKIFQSIKSTLRIDSKEPSKLDNAKAEYNAVKGAYRQVMQNNPSAKQAQQVLAILIRGKCSAGSSRE